MIRSCGFVTWIGWWAASSDDGTSVLSWTLTVRISLNAPSQLWEPGTTLSPCYRGETEALVLKRWGWDFNRDLWGWAFGGILGEKMGLSPCGIPGSGWGLQALPWTPQPGAVPAGMRGLAPLHLPPSRLHSASGEVVGLVCAVCLLESWLPRGRS